MSAGALGPLAGSIGTALGATGATATAIGNAAINAALTVAQGGNLQDALKAAAASGLSQAAVNSVANFAQTTGAQIASQMGGTAGDIAGKAVQGAITGAAGALPSALATGNFGSVLTAAASGAITTGSAGVLQSSGLSSKDIGAAIGIAKGIQSGDLTQVLAGANNFIDSPELGLATSASRLATAISSGNQAAITSAIQGFGSEIDKYQTGKTVSAAYADPSRSQDVLQPTPAPTQPTYSAYTPGAAYLDRNTPVDQLPTPTTDDELNAYVNRLIQENAPTEQYAALPALAVGLARGVPVANRYARHSTYGGK